MAAPEHVGIVGVGFTGTSALFQLVDRYPVKRITIFEAAGAFGPGYPYRQDDCPDYLINNTTDSLCLAPSNRRAFITWLKGRPDIARDLDEKGHLPRRVFGAFLEDVVAATRTLAAVRGIEVELVPKEVTSLRADTSGVVLSADGLECHVDAVILTTGRCPDLDPYPRPLTGSGSRYIPNHIRTRSLDELPLDATVHVLGTSLSSYDVVNRLFASDTGCSFERRDGNLVFVPGPNARHVVLCSRNGRLKNCQSRFPSRINREHFTPSALRAAAHGRGLTLAEIAEAIQRDAGAHGECIDWQSVAQPYATCRSVGDVTTRAGHLLHDAIARAADPAGKNILVDLFVNAQMDIWDTFAAQLLAPDQERLYRDRFESSVLTYAAPCPISTAEKLLALIRAGRLSIVKGVRGVTIDDATGRYAIAHDYGVETASTLVNATGSVDRDVTSPRQPPLIRDLARQGLLGPYQRDGHTMKGADVDTSTLSLPGAPNVYLANMLLWGPGFFTSSAFVMASLVQRTLTCMFVEAKDNRL